MESDELEDEEYVDEAILYACTEKKSRWGEIDLHYAKALVQQVEDDLQRIIDFVEDPDDMNDPSYTVWEIHSRLATIEQELRTLMP